jgi:YkoY family integral membrane protein
MMSWSASRPLCAPLLRRNSFFDGLENENSTLATFFAIAGIILYLVLLEGLLSGDNALVLALMVRHLPKEQRTRALRYGMWGAFGFRFLAVIFADFLLQFWWLKVVGGVYLLWLALRHLLGRESEGAQGVKPRFGDGFWPTVFNVELTDIAFSIDSILAAVAMARGLPANLQTNHQLVIGIIWTGGILGIIMMRLVAGVFLTLLDRFKGLARGAYYLVAWIGLKLVGSGMHDAFHNSVLWDSGWRARVPLWIKKFPWEMHDVVFWSGMTVIVVLSLVLKPKGDAGTGGLSALLDEPASPNGKAEAPQSDPSAIA